MLDLPDAAGLRRLGLPFLRHAEGFDACSILTVAVPDPFGFDAVFRGLVARPFRHAGVVAPSELQ